MAPKARMTTRGTIVMCLLLSARRIIASVLILTGWGAAAPSARAQFQPSDRMTPMNHGPFVSTTFSADPLSPRGILAHKAIVVQIAADPQAVIAFDTDLLRVAGAWTGGFLKWYPARDGLQEWPSPDGFDHHATSARPGWSLDRKFTDPRAWKYGPMSPARGAYKGLHLHGERVVFSYSVGGCDVLESHAFERVGPHPVFRRVLNLSATQETLSLSVLQAPDGPATELERVDASEFHGYVRIRAGGEARLVGHHGLPAGAAWRLTDRHLILDLPPLSDPVRLSLLIGPVAPLAAEAPLVARFSELTPSPDLSPLREPGPARWSPLETQAVAGEGEGPFVVDDLTLPADNPWHSFLRLSAVDFLDDDRAVVTSLSGDVWVVAGLAAREGTLRWRRFATGLNQPLGVKVVDGRILVTGRDQITRLHDLDGDGEADFYENFNNEVMAATNFHAFTLNLDTDTRGNLYFAKATPWPPESQGVRAEITPHHGRLFRLPAQGGRLEAIASGLRNPNGLSIGPAGDIVASDNEGNWVPTSKVHRIERGGFHGFIPSAHRDTPQRDFVKPIVWIPHFVDNSPSTPIFITSPTWPEVLQNQLLLTSYGRGTLSLVLVESVGNQWQGSHVKLPLAFNSGTQHARFHRDGHLYVAGLTSWQSVGHGGARGSLHRVRYTGRPLRLPVAVTTKPGQLELVFSDALDRASATDPANVSLSMWTYPWTSRYGTQGQVYSIKQPGRMGSDPLMVEGVHLSDDGRTLTLNVPELRDSLVTRTLGVLPNLPDMIEASLGLVVAIDYRFRTQDGADLHHVLHKTIHRVPGDTESASTLPHSGSASEGVQSVSPPMTTGHGSNASSSAPAPGRAIVAASGRPIELRSSGVALSYDVTEIRAKTGERLSLRYVNASEMVHNLVIVRSERDIEPVGIAGLAAHATEWVPASERARILEASPLAQPGQTVTLDFTAPSPGVYPYICTFSGHFTVMQGRLIVEP